jgi:hypothetical protein
MTRFGEPTRGLLKAAVTFAAVGSLSLGCATAPDRGLQPNPALVPVRTLYIGHFGNLEASDLVREKVRARLVQSKRFVLVESPERADGVLTGAAGVETSFGGGQTRFAGLGMLRVVTTKSQQTVWVHEYERGFGFGSVSTRVANQMVDALLRDAGP